MKKWLLGLSTSLVVSSLYSFSALAIDVFEADRLYKNEQYKQAQIEYSKAAQVGSPHAFYQLGTIYLKGYDVPQDSISAFIWLSLAAEYNFSDSKKAAKEVFDLLSSKQQQNAEIILSSIKQKLSKESVQLQYFPQLSQENLKEKVTFGGDGNLDIVYQDADLILDDFSTSFADDSFYDDVSLFGDPNEDGDGFSSDAQEAQTGVVRVPAQFIQRTPF
ncbi:hypothetical protein RS130_14695 [Paraglaciecola aquimarina]|uniref:Sel1 repeat family protein n=1 Tax=Paraglaciecola aquimarina TaxID=1235557 RepID=A0ABU3SYA2_9ALTE|nr:hypothetical protein [Paraglaciecola aquimarina]MDU0354984.1 hypothetical protein [Paraglaciecola aquimarina]